MVQVENQHTVPSAVLQLMPWLAALLQATFPALMRHGASLISGSGNQVCHSGTWQDPLMACACKVWKHRA